MNTAHGQPTHDSMPFDLASLRFPITYELPDNASDEVRQTERGKLVEQLEAALRTVIGSDEVKAKSTKAAQPGPFPQREPKNGRARFRPPGTPLGYASDPLTRESSTVDLVEGPARMWVRLMPLCEPGRTWLTQDLKDEASSLSTVPLQTQMNIGYVRSDDGCGYYRGDDCKARSVAYVFSSGEVWIINAFPVNAGQCVVFEESVFTETLDQCASFLGRLGCSMPYRWIVGIEGLRGLKIVLHRARRTIGPCVADVIEQEGTYDKGEKAATLLLPFFRNVFDKCGTRRPEVTA